MKTGFILQLWWRRKAGNSRRILKCYSKENEPTRCALNAGRRGVDDPFRNDRIDWHFEDGSGARRREYENRSWSNSLYADSQRCTDYTVKFWDKQLWAREESRRQHDVRGNRNTIWPYPRESKTNTRESPQKAQEDERNGVASTVCSVKEGVRDL